MSVLDSTVGLIYSLKADDSEARKAVSDLRSHIDKETGQIEQSSKNAFLSLGKSIGLTDSQIVSLGKSLPIIGAVAAGIVAVGGAAVGVGVGLFELAKNASEYGSSIKEASEKTGLGAETLSAMNSAAKQSGVSLEQITGSTAKFSKTVAEAAKGSQEAKDKLTRLGVDPQSAIKDLDGALGTVFARIQSLPPGVIQSSAAMDAFGKSGAELLPFIKQFDGDLPGLIAKAKELGVTLSDADADAADEFGDSLDQLKSQAAGVAFQFAKEFMPVITQTMKDISGWFMRNKETISWWGKEVRSEILTLIDTIDKFKKAWHWLTVQRSAKLDSNFGQELPGQSPVAGPKVIDYTRPEAPKPADNSDYLADLDKQREAAKKAAEELKKKQEEYEKATLDGRKRILQEILEAEKAAFAKSEEFNEEHFKARNVSADVFRDAYLRNEATYLKRLEAIAVESSKLETAGETNPTKLKAARLALQNELNTIADDSAKRQAAAEKLITDTVKTETEKRAKLTEDETNRSIEKNKQSTEKKISDLEVLYALGKKTEKEFIDESDDLKYKSLVFARSLNQALLKDTTLTAEQRISIEKNIADGQAEIDRSFNDSTLKNIDLRKRDAEAQKQAAEEILNIKREVLEVERQIKDAEADARRFALEKAVDDSTAKTRRQNLISLREFEISEAARKRDETNADLEAEKKKALEDLRERAEKSVELKKREEEEKFQIEELYKQKKLLSEAEFQQKLKEIQDGFKKPVDGAEVEGAGKGGILGGIIDGMGFSIDEMLQKVEPLKEIGNIIGAQFDAIAGAVGNAVKSFVLFGTAGGSFRKFAAEVLASIAQMSIVQALFELAQGFAMLALSYFTGNPKYGAAAGGHFTAAAVFGAIGGVTAIAGRAVAGDSFKQQTASGSSTGGNSGGSGGNSGGSNKSSDDQERTINESRRQSQESERKITIEVISKVQSNDSHILNTVVNNIADLGEFRDVILKLQEG